MEFTLNWKIKACCVQIQVGKLYNIIMCRYENGQTDKQTDSMDGHTLDTECNTQPDMDSSSTAKAEVEPPDDGGQV